MTAIGHFFAGRYSDAALWAEKAVREQPSLITLRVAAASYASAGRSEDAHQAIARALQFDPDMRVSNLQDRLMQSLRSTGRRSASARSVPRPQLERWRRILAKRVTPACISSMTHR